MALKKNISPCSPFNGTITRIFFAMTSKWSLSFQFLIAMFLLFHLPVLASALPPAVGSGIEASSPVFSFKTFFSLCFAVSSLLHAASGLVFNSYFGEWPTIPRFQFSVFCYLLLLLRIFFKFLSPSPQSYINCFYMYSTTGNLMLSKFVSIGPSNSCLLFL